MSDEKPPPPRRHESDANRIPQEVLEEASRSNIPPPPLAEAMRDAVWGPRIPPGAEAECTLCHGHQGGGEGDEDTMESCPRCGSGMVTPAVARAYRLEHDPAATGVDEGIEIDLTTDPDEET